MNIFIDSNNHLNIDITFSVNNTILLNYFSDLMYSLFNKLFKDFFDIRTGITYPFETGGYSGCLILGESHINWHTFPENGLLKMQIYSCKDIENKVSEVLKELYTVLNPISIEYSFSNNDLKTYSYK